MHCKNKKTSLCEIKYGDNKNVCMHAVDNYGTMYEDKVYKTDVDLVNAEYICILCIILPILFFLYLV